MQTQTKKRHDSALDADLKDASNEFEQDARQVLNDLGYITQDQFVALAGVLPSTAAAWRKRGEGPSYALVGNRYAYPVAAIKTWLDSQLREREVKESAVGGLL